jgi:hypothetical protein
MKFGLLFLLQDPPNGEHIPRLYDEVFEQAELAERNVLSDWGPRSCPNVGSKGSAL